LKEFVEEMFEEWQNSQDEVDRNKYNILNQSLMDFDNFQVKLDDAVADLEEKSKLLQDNERMRWARQRAAQLAAQ
jgi:polyhydroxyalkanoate synthesis regulator phasin